MRIKTDKIRRLLIEALVFILIFEFSPLSSLSVAKAQAQSDMPMVPASGSTEWQSKRTANSKTFVNANGSITTKIYPSPIHYYKNGILSKGWEEIDNNLKISDSPLGLFGEKYLVNGANSFQTSYKDNASGEYFKFNIDGAEINFSLKETRNPVTSAKTPFDQIALKSVLARYQKNKVTYSQIKPGVNLTQYVLSDRVKEEITLNRYLESNVLVLSFSADNLTWTKMSDGRIVFRDIRNNKKVFSFDKPVMYDSRGGRNNIDNIYSSAVSYKIVKNADYYDFIITPDNNWLKDPSRVYPVIIDPTIYNGVAGDTYSEEGFPTTNTSDQRALYTGRGDTKLGMRSYIAYQLPDIGGGRILSAQADVYQ
ncbi:MAG: hypothetical protein NT039_01335, partial [Candidatus Berkelbacteria bacterium]|nr:hypothetical protein [Candidatus Berkelbacteria bacterium]